MTEIRRGTVPIRGIRPRPDDVDYTATEHLLEPLLYASKPTRDEPLRCNLRCARCGETTAYAVHVNVVASADYEQRPVTRLSTTNDVTELTLDDAPLHNDFGNRGPTVAVVFYCDLGHYFTLEIGNHKGSAFAGVYSWDEEADD